MKSRAIDREFLRKMGDAWKPATPGLCIQAHHEGKKVLDVEVGDTYEIYDWASVTKIVFTTSALMMQFDQRRFGLNDSIEKWVEWFPEKSPATVRHLLIHSAGMNWWYPFYKTMVKRASARTSPEEAWRIFETVLRRRVLLDLRKNGLKKNVGGKSVYSDLDFFTLGLILEKMTGASLQENWNLVRERAGLRDTDFNRGNKPRGARSRYAPTEKDTSFRHKLLQGEVHDQNTWSFRGVAPHAGLFGPMEDLSRWGLALRASLRGDRGALVSEKTARLFTKRGLPRARGDWALGFMMPSKEAASCGPFFSLDSVGHTGYTGTSLWYDPKRDLLVTILSNRIHPTVENIEIRKLRPLVHSWIVESLR